MYVKHCEIVCSVDKMPVDVQETIKKYSTIKQWAYIIHDKDDTNPHYHIYLRFNSSIDSSMIASWFGIPENFVNKIKGKKTDMLMYLTHSNDTQSGKHLYSPDEVIANFDFETEIENSKIIGDFNKYSYAQQLQYINTLSLVDKTRAFTQLKKLWELECQCLALRSDRQLKVVFVTGKAGSGKTYYAKRMLEKMNLDYCISSSSNDPFQDYMGQKAIILDDLRDKSFDLEDLLKILDNNTNSSIKSRFNNKVFNGEMIVITSLVPIHYWYSQYKNINSIETLDQLYRRINCYILVRPDVVAIYDDGLTENGAPAGNPTIIPNELYVKQHDEKNNINIGDVFKSLNEEI